MTALLLLLGLAWTGLSGGVNQLPHSDTTGEKAQTLAQFAYGLFALLSVVTAFLGRPWALLARGCFIVSLALAAGLASIVWGGTSLATGLLSGAAASVTALIIVWFLHAGTRAAHPPAPYQPEERPG